MFIQTGNGPTTVNNYSDLISYGTDGYMQPYQTSNWGSGQTLSMGFYTGLTYSWAPNSEYYGPDVVLNGILNVAHTGNTLWYTFTNVTDYERYKSEYAVVTGSTEYTGWVADTSDFDHYNIEHQEIQQSSY